MDNTDTTPVQPNIEPATGGLSFNLRALIQSPLFWMAVGAGVLYFIQHKTKQRQVVTSAPRGMLDS
jgi:hypothetical protein